jgi:cobalt-precorrin 5A hydrolase/precorrin-3B C17-methyltransferase
MAIEKKVSAIFYITGKAHSLAEEIAAYYPGARAVKFSMELLPAMWKQDSMLVFIMSSGIVVRAIAPLISDKKRDPAVVVVDENGDYVISLLSGHIGGANELAKEIATQLGAKPVITTASDLNNLPAIDLWARDNGLAIEPWDTLPKVASRLVNKGVLKVYSEKDIELPDGFIRESAPARADLLITKELNPGIAADDEKARLYLRPREIAIGIGCNSGVDAAEITGAVEKVLADHNLSLLSVYSIATIDNKANEPGLLEFARKCGVELISFPAEELNKVKGVVRSETVFRAIGAYAVAAPSALLAAGAKSLIIPKVKSGNVTVAAALKKERAAGKLYIVGTGPGSGEHITQRAREAIKESDVVIGYGTYLDLVPDLINAKEIITTGMTQETERCKKAIELARAGRTVSLISGGDPGIYAMAGLVYEMLSSEKRDSGGQADGPSAGQLSVEVIPGVAALNAAAARLGAPLMHDFASISLSDRLTPWETIEKRLDAAARADFVIVLYNPRSEGRTEQFRRAVGIISKYKKSQTPVGVVKGAMRPGENIVITDLGSVCELSIDMQTTVIVGNSATFVWNNRMITPRGYDIRRDA